ncbi:TPA: phage baseplate upper protein [Enterococcus faecalis]|nr:phage baseplate upper protein [Enterococcus faecalis]
MVKWQATLSTTEPYNYIGIQNVRQGNRNTEVLEAILVENALPLDLTGCEVFFESVIDNKYPIQRSAKIVNAKKGIIQYTFDEYSMQSLHRQEAYFSIHKGDNLIGATQNFSYFVVNAASKTEGEMGSYWQSIEDLIADMNAFINENKGDFTDWMNARKEEFEKWRKNQQDTFEAWRNGQETDYLKWFESIKDILKTVDPGGTMLAELMDARVDIQGVRHNSISERLLADMEYLYHRLEERLYTIKYGNVNTLEILEDDSFSKNHEVELVGTVNFPIEEGALIIATVDDPKQNVFTIEGADNG